MHNVRLKLLQIGTYLAQGTRSIQKRSAHLLPGMLRNAADVAMHIQPLHILMLCKGFGIPIGGQKNSIAFALKLMCKLPHQLLYTAEARIKSARENGYVHAPLLPYLRSRSALISA